MIRSVHVVSNITNPASGPSYSVVALCRALIVNGVGLELHVLDEAPAALSASLKVCAHPRWRFPHKLGISPSMKKALTQAAANIDIMHSHNLWMMPNIYSGRALRNSNCRLIISPRGTMSDWAWNWHGGRKRLIGWYGQFQVLRQAHCFHATSTEEIADIRRRGFSQPVAMIPNGVDIPERGIGSNAGMPRRLLYAGRLHPIKGIPNLLHAWKRVVGDFPDWELKIVGPDNGGHLDELLRLAKELDCPRVCFEGALFGDQLRQAFQGADIYVLPTHSENFGMTIAESLANGTPVITTKGAPWSGLEREGCGWWIDGGVDPLEKCLRAAMRIPRPILSQMGAKGREWMRRDFGWDMIGKMMRDTYEWLLGGGDEPGWVVTR